MQSSAIHQPTLGGIVLTDETSCIGSGLLPFVFLCIRLAAISLVTFFVFPVLQIFPFHRSSYCNSFTTDWVIGRLLTHDRLIHTHVTLRVLHPAILPQALRSVRAALFPNNMPGPVRIPPTADETIKIKRKCAESILGMVPLPIRKVYFGKGEKGEDDDRHRQVSEVEEILDVFGDSYLNTHLLYAVVDLLVVRLMPEMAEKGVQELRAVRLDAFA